MKRRTFIQTVAAAFGASVTGTLPNLSSIAGERDRTGIDYSRFCLDHKFGRYDLDAPFSQDGTVYATDSRILIAHEGDLPGENDGNLPEVSKLWWDEFDSRGWKPWPKFTGYHRGPNDVDDACPVCNEKGRVGADVLQVNAICPDCTIGYVGGHLCGYCQGKGLVEEGCVYVGSTHLAGALDSSIRTLGDVEYRLFQGEAYHKNRLQQNRGIVAFRFSAAGGGKGFAVPIMETQ